MISKRRRFLVSVIAVVALTLTACAGLPRSGDVAPGLPLGDTDLPPDVSEIAAGPLDGASPEEIVEGFLDAAITPTDSWATARQFLSPELAATWKPNVEVTIDSGAGSREFTADLNGEMETADSGDVHVALKQVARVNEIGAYTELSGDEAVTSYEVAQNEEGEWRITRAANGIVLDAQAFTQVFRRHSLQYFDQGWSHLIPDVRWYPRRPQIVTTLTLALLEDAPSEWLATAVRTAFPNDVALARDAVPVSSDKVATVELTANALELGATELSRMRTQLESTLRSAGVSEVRLTVNGRDLNAGTASISNVRPEPGTVVLTEAAFGVYVGDEITPYDDISAQIVELGASVTAADVAADGTRAAVQLDTGVIFTVSEGRIDELDSRPQLVKPSMDPYGYTWSVPSNAPQDLIAWQADVTSSDDIDAFPDVSSVSQIRVGPAGARIAAVVMVGQQHWVALAAIQRDQNNVPVALGPLHMVAQLDSAALGLSWVGEEQLSVLVEAGENRVVLTQDVGGPGMFAAAPEGAKAISGGKTVAAVRILNDSGVLFAQRGATWQIGLSDVLVLGTRAGQ
ncbi:GerMN domain-containing protein [Microbacterium sp. A82]|uniref:GerMN domain-containing protein n=1 Tax=Microbacterium sp. A82 TaxID=3450452 RepID=UPI003F314BB9